MAASAVSKNSQCDIQECHEQPPLQDREVIKPSISELTKEVRTNILCTVVGCGKILPNTPALNMHLVKSHRIKEGLVNPTIRKDIKDSQKLYCCPVEGCPRGPNRPFSQFSLVKQHFMKMHAEKKHKCLKCSNSYSTEWDLRRHSEDCGRTYSCTCGCPYASRAALLSHIYRTGHEVPKEHRYPPVKKRKMERLASNATNGFPNEQTYEMLDSKKSLTEVAVPPEGVHEVPDTAQHKLHYPRNIQKLLLPKPKVALVNVPVMQLTHLPVLLPSTESSVLRSLVFAVGVQGSISTVQLLPQSAGAMVPELNTKTASFRDTLPVPRSGPETMSTGVQVNLEDLSSVEDQVLHLESRGKGTSTNIQTAIPYLSRGVEAEPVNAHLSCEASVSSCSQTDISVSAQIQLPISVQTQTLPSRIRALSSIGAQTDVFSFSSFNVTRETQTSCSAVAPVDKIQMDQAMCTDLFDTETLTVSTQTAAMNAPFRTSSLEDTLSNTTTGLFEDKTSMCYRPQTDILHNNTVADNQTQTMILFRDLENILSDHLGAAASGCGSGLVPVHESNHAGIDFDFEEFLNATHIQTQTEESGSSCLNTETTLELLDIETQTDFLLFDNLGDGHNSNVGTRVHPNDLELEMFDTQTQTDLNFLLETSGHMPLSSILRQSSFSMSTESSDTETQTDVRSGPLSLSCTHDAQVRLSSAKTQTISTSLHSLGHRFHTSNETQTAVDDFLSADLAWNMESHFSSVETQTYPPVKKRKMERLASNATNGFPNEQTYEMLDSKKSLTEVAVPPEGVHEVPDTAQHKLHYPRNIQKLLLPKPKVALVNVPVMQLTHLPVLLPSTESSVLRSLVFAVGVQGSISTVQLLPQSAGAMVPELNTKTASFRDTLPVPRSGPETMSTGVQVNLEDLSSVEDQVLHLESRGKGTSTNIQTAIPYLSRGVEAEPVNAHLSCEASVSSCSQTDISVSAQIQLPISVQTQTLPSRIRALSSIGAQTDVFSFSSFNVTRETQTSCSAVAPVDKIQMDQAMCTDLFDTETLTVSTQTAAMNAPFRTSSLEDTLSNTTTGLFEDKTSMCYRPQTDILHNNTVADNQTQTMILFRDLENILSDHLGAAASGCGSGLVPVHESNHAGIDFDFEEFLNATHIQTQTEESGSSCLNTETTLELLDIETQTDFLLFDNLGDGHNSNVGTRVHPNDLELEMFDTQTQTDLNFLLETSGHMPLSSILRQSSFSMSTESSDTETQTDVRSGPLSLSCTHDAQVRLSSAKTQTISTSLHSLGHRFHTSNETQTAVDDFLSADLAWNMESHFSSVETQTCEELISLFSHAEKSKN